jgi:hypothetical protein
LVADREFRGNASLEKEAYILTAHFYSQDANKRFFEFPTLSKWSVRCLAAITVLAGAATASGQKTRQPPGSLAIASCSLPIRNAYGTAVAYGFYRFGL